jgi:type II secretory pathway component PulC
LIYTLLLSAIAVLSLANWHLYTTPIDVSPLAPPSRSSASTEAKDLELSTPLDNKPSIVFEQTVQRPLFNADRKPIERSKQAVEAPVAALNTGMQLVGIVKSAGAPGRALIRFAGEPTGKWVPEGETVNGWRLTTVKTVSVVLEGNGQTQELHFKAAAQQTTGEAAAEPGPQPPKRKTR